MTKRNRDEGYKRQASEAISERGLEFRAADQRVRMRELDVLLEMERRYQRLVTGRHVWIVGGPRSGKTTLGEGLQREIGTVHLSGGEMWHGLLLAGIVTESDKNDSRVKEYIVRSMSRKARESVETGGAKMVTYDGLRLSDWGTFEDLVGPVMAVIELECSEETQIKRYEQRVKEGDDLDWGVKRSRNYSAKKARGEVMWSERVEAACGKHYTQVLRLEIDAEQEETVVLELGLQFLQNYAIDTTVAAFFESMDQQFWMREFQELGNERRRAAREYTAFEGRQVGGTTATAIDENLGQGKVMHEEYSEGVVSEKVLAKVGMIIQITSCVGARADGLSKCIADRLKHDCVYAGRQAGLWPHIAREADWEEPGTIAVSRARSREVLVVSVNAKWGTGLAGRRKMERVPCPERLGSDRTEDRLRWFEEGLRTLERDQSLVGNIAFPYDLAKENWLDYRELIVQFAERNPEVTVFVVGRAGPTGLEARS